MLKWLFVVALLASALIAIGLGLYSLVGGIYVFALNSSNISRVFLRGAFILLYSLFLLLYAAVSVRTALLVGRDLPWPSQLTLILQGVSILFGIVGVLAFPRDYWPFALAPVALAVVTGALALLLA